MTTVLVIIAAVGLAYLGLGWFVSSSVKPSKRTPPVEQVRDAKLDIRPALERDDARWN